MGFASRGSAEEPEVACDQPIPRDAAWAKAVRGYGRIKAGQLDDGITELGEALAWFESAQMRWTYIIGAVWLAEGYLRCGNRAGARTIIEHVLTTSRITGYRQYEGRACWLMAECVASESLDAAQDYIETAIRIFESIGARNDLAKAIATRAALHQRVGDVIRARELFERASEIFRALGTIGENDRLDAAMAILATG